MNFLNYSTPAAPAQKKAELPATPFQILAERLFPLISLMVLFGFLQLLSAIYYHPTEASSGIYNISSPSRLDLPFPVLVRNTRVGLGMSRRMLAQKVGLTIANIESIEEGGATPTHDVEVNLRQVLGLPLNVLQGELVITP
ncbi:MAG TPA: hypothetical protein ENK85_04940 [Saprospiraceae bacterium]|nr:hypothetical protein [Saprospiraceae bacterium]